MIPVLANSLKWSMRQAKLRSGLLLLSDSYILYIDVTNVIDDISKIDDNIYNGLYTG